MICYGSHDTILYDRDTPVTQNACLEIPYHGEFEVFDELGEFYMDFEVI